MENRQKKLDSRICRERISVQVHRIALASLAGTSTPVQREENT